MLIVQLHSMLFWCKFIYLYIYIYKSKQKCTCQKIFIFDYKFFFFAYFCINNLVLCCVATWIVKSVSWSKTNWKPLIYIVALIETEMNSALWESAPAFTSQQECVGVGETHLDLYFTLFFLCACVYVCVWVNEKDLERVSWSSSKGRFHARLLFKSINKGTAPQGQGFLSLFVENNGDTESYWHIWVLSFLLW